jgi:prepilin-type N-terminal cleavage/methylation domain-containing protein
MIFSSNTPSHSPRLRAGFGLIELLVSISIMVLVTSIVLARHSAFNGTVLLKSQAYEIALRLREVQLSAVSVATSTVGIRSQYGARFLSTATENNRYAVFATPLPLINNFYSLANYQLVGAPGLLDQRFVIKGVRLNCSSSVVETNNVIIIFKRPNYDAEFRNSNGGPLPASCVLPISGATIRIGPRGSLATATSTERTVTVTRAGQISVD